jgi:hypothetical protein
MVRPVAKGQNRLQARYSLNDGTAPMRRAADAVRQARSNDIIVLAWAALEAAVRGDRDLLELFPADPLATRRDIVGPVHEPA